MLLLYRESFKMRSDITVSEIDTKVALQVYSFSL
jgi:hypothetical protein